MTSGEDKREKITNQVNNWNGGHRTKTTMSLLRWRPHFEHTRYNIFVLKPWQVLYSNRKLNQVPFFVGMLRHMLSVSETRCNCIVSLGIRVPVWVRVGCFGFSDFWREKYRTCSGYFILRIRFWFLRSGFGLFRV